MSRFINELHNVIGQPVKKITGTVLAITNNTVRVKTARGTKEFTRTNAVDYKPDDKVRISGGQILGKVQNRKKFNRYLV